MNRTRNALRVERYLLFAQCAQCQRVNYEECAFGLWILEKSCKFLYDVLCVHCCATCWTATYSSADRGARCSGRIARCVSVFPILIKLLALVMINSRKMDQSEAIYSTYFAEISFEDILMRFAVIPRNLLNISLENMFSI